MLFVVTGASGSGKTAIAPDLATLLPGVAWYDFDSLGVPEGADTEWRQSTLTNWMLTAIEEESRGLDMILSGQLALGEVLASPPAPYLNGLAVCLLDCEDITRIQRLRLRGDDPDQDMLNWAAWLRVHVVDPTWRQDVIRSTGSKELQWSRWSEWTAADPRWAAHRIDTTPLTISEVAKEVVAWIEATGPSRPNPVREFAT